MYVKTEGIVLSSIKYSDSKCISHIFTRKYGKNAFIFRISAGKKSSKKQSLFHPLSFVDLEFRQKENANLQHLNEWKPSYIYHQIPYDDIKRTVVLFLAELLNRVLREESYNEELYNFLSNALQYYDLQESKYADFHLWFLIQLSRYLGFGPTRDVENNLYFDLLEGIFTRLKPIHPKYLEGRELEIFSQLLKVGLVDYNLVSTNRKLRLQLLDKIIEYYILQFDELSDLKSIAILKEVFK